MPSNKKHHYVPRFYLRHFSKTGKSINLYNIPSHITVIDASLKEQCYKDYFYGNNQEVEKAFSDLENFTSLILKKLIDTNELPKFNSEEYQILIFFIILQYYRTLYSAEAENEDTDILFKCFYAQRIKALGLNPDKFKITLQKPALEAASFTAQAFFYILDLNIKVLLNRTSLEFLTSDNPVAFYNQLLEYRTQLSNCGLRTKGLQIYFPINPNSALFLYDRWSYKVSSKLKKIITIDSKKDIEELNKLQIISALDNIYFRDPNQAPLIERIAHETSSLRRPAKSITARYVREDNKLRELITRSKYDIRTGLSLSFVSEKWRARIWRARYKRQKVQQVAIMRNSKYLSKIIHSCHRQQNWKYPADLNPYTH
ncbi:MAG: DUF4238 domain-containing protein [Candidatus Aureabacteria bacterium]|nr:DUF4238 domain-containing protein [Candidatus Auribacterota bacterium]